ncbi:hypothetical protein N7528_009637 [Penicillium herquei]|nr:hypothetical protein N7528_009637 [Penicillium herquei]
MKRDAQGNPITTVHRWSRPPLSCHACRDKKRRCDRAQPCSNCVLRNIPCEYSGQSPEGSLSGPDQSQIANPGTKSSQWAVSKPGSVQSDPVPHMHHMSNLDGLNNSPSIVELARKLPPLWQAKELFNHFAAVIQPTIGVLHIPSTRRMIEKIYEGILDGQQPPAADLMLTFSIFAGAVLGWTPVLLGKLSSTSEEAQSALISYSRLALAILDHDAQILEPSTTALVAIVNLGHILMNTDCFPLRVHTLRNHCLLMARELSLHRLDTAKAREERRLKGCNMIDVEVQRRAWWNLVASDWLLAFAGGPQDGAYVFQPKHMNVNMPTNTDDELITSDGIQQMFPPSMPTVISGFYARVQCADLCRQVVDALPSILLDAEEPEYATIMDLDTRFHDHIASLPAFFKLDQESIEQCRQICKERPYIAWQRLSVHFSLHTRLCRLHRAYHLEGITNPKYAYSHMVCIRSAHKVLEIRRAMDDLVPELGLRPARFWTVMHHVFLAALILATDVSFNPTAPDAAARKAKVLAAYSTLEQSKRESNNLMEGLQKNLQTLMSTLHTQRLQGSMLPSEGLAADIPTGNQLGNETGQASEVTFTQEKAATTQPSSLLVSDGHSLINDMDEDGWEKLWSEFVAVAPVLDVPQWNSLLEDVDFPLI